MKNLEKYNTLSYETTYSTVDAFAQKQTSDDAFSTINRLMAQDNYESLSDDQKQAIENWLGEFALQSQDTTQVATIAKFRSSYKNIDSSLFIRITTQNRQNKQTRIKTHRAIRKAPPSTNFSEVVMAAGGDMPTTQEDNASENKFEQEDSHEIHLQESTKKTPPAPSESVNLHPLQAESSTDTPNSNQSIYYPDIGVEVIFED